MQRAWVMLALTMVIVAFALSTGFPMFHRAYYVFGLLLIFSALWVWLLVQGIHVDVRRPVLRSRAGGEIEEKITVYRRNPFLRGFVEIQEQTDMSIAPPGAVISMGSADMTALDLKVPCPRRGIFKVGPIQVAGSDPFGLFRLRRSVGESHKVIVHPDTLELPGFHILPAELPGEGARHLRSQSVTTSAFGIRDYQFGDSLNRISWKATAHHNALMVKEFEVEPANTTWVLVDMERRAHTGSGDEGTEETAISVAASICKRYLDSNYPVGFMADGNERFVIPAQRGAGMMVLIMDALAALRAQGNLSMLDLIGDLQSRAGRYTSVALVTPDANPGWLAGVRHLLDRKTRITVVVVDGDLSKETEPESAYEAASLGVPTYTVKRGSFAATGLVPLNAAAQAPGRPTSPAAIR